MCVLSETELLLLEKGSLTCSDIEDALCDYVDGEFSSLVTERLGLHFELCEECRDGLRLYKEVIDIAKTFREPIINEESWVDEEVSPALSGGIRERLHSSLNAKLGLRLPV